MGKKRNPLTKQEKKLLLAKLLQKVTTCNETNKWTQDNFARQSVHVCIKINDALGERKLEKAAAVRFFKLLMQEGYFVQTANKSIYRPDMDPMYLKDKSDAQMIWLGNIISDSDIFQTRGRIPGVSPAKREEDEEVYPIVMEEEVVLEPVSEEVATEESAALEIAQAILTFKKHNIRITINL